MRCSCARPVISIDKRAALAALGALALQFTRRVEDAAAPPMLIVVEEG
jgi:hypothetical protein